MGIRTKTKLRHSLSLFLVLAVFWLLLSGTVSMRLSDDGLHLNGLILALGLVSCALVVLISLRMELMAQITQPLRLHYLRLIGYWLWLTKKIIVANVDVARRIINPALPIHPTVVRTCSTQRSSVARTIFANSITLTPGTVSIEVSEDHIMVHALTRESAHELASCDMDERVSGLERQ